MTPTHKALEAAARAMCDSWGYSWEHDPDDDQTVAPDGEEVTYCPRPSQTQFKEAARAAILAFLSAVKSDFDAMSLLGSACINDGKGTFHGTAEAAIAQLRVLAQETRDNGHV